MTILAVYREPFGFEPQVAHLSEGLSLADLAKRMPGLPHDFRDRGTICVNGRPVARKAWGMIKPKPMHNGVPVEVTFHATPMGGGSEDGGEKQILALVASLALIAVTGGIAANGIASLGIKGGTFLARAVAGGIGLVGSLALSALSAPPVFLHSPPLEAPTTTASTSPCAMSAAPTCGVIACCSLSSGRCAATE